MKRALIVLIAGTVLSGFAAVYAAAQTRGTSQPASGEIAGR
jgi:hypothetical protein